MSSRNGPIFLLTRVNGLRRAILVGSTGGPDAVQVHQVGASGGHEHFELLVGGLAAGVDAFQVRDQLGGDPTPDLAGGIAGTDPGQQDLGLGGGKVLLRPTRNELEQQLVQLAGHPSVVLTQRATPVDQEPEHGELLVVGDRP